MPVSLAKPILRVTSDKLFMDDINFILSVAIQNLKTVEHSLTLLKGVSLNMPLSSWLEKTAELKNDLIKAVQTEISKSD